MKVLLLFIIPPSPICLLLYWQLATTVWRSGHHDRHADVVLFFLHSPCGETTNSFIFLPYSSLFLVPFLSPHATVRQRTNTLVFLIKCGVLQGERQWWMMGERHGDKWAALSLWMQKFMLCFNHSGRIHLIFKRARKSNTVRTEFNLSSLQVAPLAF